MADVALQDEWSLAEEQALQLSQAAINRFISETNKKLKFFSCLLDRRSREDHRCCEKRAPRVRFPRLGGRRH